MTPLTYTEPKNPMDPADVDVVTTTVEGYDKKQVMSQLYQYAIGIGMISLMHFKWGYIRPLTLQAVLGLKALFELPLVKVHILGQQSVGALARPWKPKSLFGYFSFLQCLYGHTHPFFSI